MFNHSIFDHIDIDEGRDRGCPTLGPEQIDADHESWEVPTAAGIPSAVLVVVVVGLLIRQNLDRLRGLVDSINQLIATLRDSVLSRFDNDENEMEMHSVAIGTSPPRGPRNLSDEEIERMRCAPQGTQWV